MWAAPQLEGGTMKADSEATLFLPAQLSEDGTYLPGPSYLSKLLKKEILCLLGFPTFGEEG